MTQRWKNRPDGSNWGEFGPDDQKGRLNLLTPESVVKAVREVETGERFCLSLPLDYPGGRLLNSRRFPPRLFATQRGGLANFNLPLHISDPRLTDVVCDDAALICLQYSTQWDSLCHVGGWFDADGDGDAESANSNFRNLDAAIDTSLGSFIAITMKNETANNKMQAIIGPPGGACGCYVNFETLTLEILL